MKPTSIGPFIIGNLPDSRPLDWSSEDSSFRRDLRISVGVPLPRMGLTTFEIGLIEFVTRMGNLLLQAIVFRTSGDPDDFSGELPEIAIRVDEKGAAYFLFDGILEATSHDPLLLLRQLVLLGDAEMLPTISKGGVKAAVSAPMVGIPLGVRSIKQTFLT
jgi:hypothetical protein